MIYYSKLLKQPSQQLLFTCDDWEIGSLSLAAREPSYIWHLWGKTCVSPKVISSHSDHFWQSYRHRHFQDDFSQPFSVREAVQPCAIHLCQPLYQPVCVCVCALKWLMNSSLSWWALQSQTSIQPHQLDLLYKQNCLWLDSGCFNMTLQPLWWSLCCEAKFPNVKRYNNSLQSQM